MKFWPTSAKPQPAAPAAVFDMEEAKERVAKLKVPDVNEPLRMHAVVKLAPIPLPRSVRYESQAIYFLALIGTALLIWLGFQIPPDWLLWYGMAALLVFAGLFRIEGPLTRAEHRARTAQVRLSHDAYIQAEMHLKEVMESRFNERMAEFQSMQCMYEDACKAATAIEKKPGHTFLSAIANPARTEKTEADLLAAKIESLEEKMAALVAELEDFSDIYKEEIDAALMARHNARLAYWQAKLDEAVVTGEALQQH